MFFFRKGEQRPQRETGILSAFFMTRKPDMIEARGVQLRQREEAQNKKSPVWPQAPATQSQAGSTSVSWTATSPVHMDTDQGAYHALSTQT